MQREVFKDWESKKSKITSSKLGECKTGFKDSYSLVKRIGKGRFSYSDS